MAKGSPGTVHHRTFVLTGSLPNKWKRVVTDRVYGVFLDLYYQRQSQSQIFWVTYFLSRRCVGGIITRGGSRFRDGGTPGLQIISTNTILYTKTLGNARFLCINPVTGRVIPPLPG